MTAGSQPAPGWPGIPPRWTSSAKSGIGTALRASSRVWFTISHGILNEVYYPRIDQACLRDLGLLITDGHGFVSEEKRDAVSHLAWLAPGVPGYRLVNTCRQGRYRITKEIVSDPRRDVVLQHARVEALQGTLSDYRTFVLLSPHLGNAGWQNTAWVGDYKGVPMLFAQRDGLVLAAACDPGWTRASAGFVGTSDGWQDVRAHGRMTWEYDRAENGNVALMGEVDLASGDGTFVTALAFGNSASEAGHRARASLLEGFASARDEFVRDWTTWEERLEALALCGSALPKTSVAVLRCHEEKRMPGAIIASLSIPWGDTKGDNDLGGYHLVWPRDLVEVAGGLLAAGAYGDALRVLSYLRTTQDVDGSWSQNMWVDGDPYWHGIQLDETAFPILLVDLVQRSTNTEQVIIDRFWPMVRRAASFIVRNGPVTEQDRWEEEAGLSPFTVAVQVAALLTAADMADRLGEPVVASYLRETADAWNDSLDRCIYVEGSDLARRVGVEGYYVRIAPPETAEAGSPAGGFVPIKNRPWPQADKAAAEIASPDALALVRFGLRSPHDRRILNTVTVIDALLEVDFAFGPVWRRYNEDGYGEHEDGSAFDGTGTGRPWPLLTGERAHYEIAAGRLDEARRLLATFESCANDGGLLPEQVWDGTDVVDRELFHGRPTGGAMPLAWAHAEHLKLVRSLHDGRVFDMPLQTWQRYVVQQTRSAYACWRFNHRLQHLPAGLTLRIETLVPCMVHWSSDGWQTTHDVVSHDPGLGEHVADLATGTLLPDATVDFTIYWSETERWEGVDFHVDVARA